MKCPDLTFFIREFFGFGVEFFGVVGFFGALVCGSFLGVLFVMS